MIGNTSVIIGGDSNVPLNYEIDTEKYLNKNKPKAQQKVHALMADLDLIDVWQKNNPSVKSYTWRSPNSKRSRLDCF
jgi:exonuclease III